MDLCGAKVVPGGAVKTGKVDKGYLSIGIAVCYIVDFFQIKSFAGLNNLNGLPSWQCLGML